MQKLRLKTFLRKQTYKIFLFLYILFAIHHSNKMLVFAVQIEIWIAENFNFIVFEDFCLSLSWKYRFSQHVSHAKVQSKTKKYCKFNVDPTR